MNHYKTTQQYHYDVEKSINKSLQEAYIYGHWYENYITESMLVNLKKKFKNSKIDDIESNVKYSQCAWDVFKNKGKIENKYGDIAILVQIHLSHNKILEGVAFLEAKRIYHETRRFKQINIDQLRRMCTYTPYHRTVLFDVIETENKILSRASTLPSSHLLALKIKTRNLNKYAENLSSCLIQRYMNGYELDFRTEVVAAVKGASESKIGVNYLIVAQSAFPRDLELNLRQIEVNREIYQPLNNEPQFDFNLDNNDPEPDDDFGPGM